MKTAIVVFNLGGPDRPEAVKPFRINLFMDRAIIRAPIFIRFWLSRLIAARSQQAAEENYAYMGGKSPLLEFTQRQAAALQTALGGETRTFIAMRYWHPFAAETAAAVKAYAPERILLLPLYPQFSTTTTGSSLSDWHENAAKAGLAAATTTLCCYFDHPSYTAAIATLVDGAITAAKSAIAESAIAKAAISESTPVAAGAKLRLLFSAHGLPQSIVDAGDPYQWQVEQTVAAVLAQLQDRDVEHVVCYQSRATPQKWISPSTIECIEQAGADQVAVLLVPIAFVSDHIETLVELDIENKELAAACSVPFYFRAPVPNDDPAFIAALARLATHAVDHGEGLCSAHAGRACDPSHQDCPWTKHAR